MKPRGPGVPPARATSSNTRRAVSGCGSTKWNVRPRARGSRPMARRGAHDLVDRHEVERLVASPRQRQRQIGRRRHDEEDEQVRPVEAIDLAGARVADDRRRAHDGDRQRDPSPRA